MNAMSRPLATLAAAAVGGAGLWLAGHWDTTGNGGYWAMLGIVAAAGLLLGLSQLRSPDGNVAGMFLVAWLPIAIAAGWVLVAHQPDPTWSRNHVRAWSADIGVGDVVNYLGPFVTVLALAIGLVFGLTLLAGYVWRRESVTVVDEAPAETVATPPAAAQQPVTTTEREPVTVAQPGRRVMLVP